MYKVIDRKTGKVIGIYQTLKRAKRKIDKLDNEYGAYRYYSHKIETPIK
jgi:hypothetical protein